MKEQVFSHPALLLSSGVTSVGFNVSNFLQIFLVQNSWFSVRFFFGAQYKACNGEAACLRVDGKFPLMLFCTEQFKATISLTEIFL